MVGRFASVVRGPSGRVTNLAVLAALVVAFATGVGAVANGSPGGRWVVIAHGIGGIAVILLLPWKGRVVRRGLRRVRWTRWLSLLLAVLAILALLTGVGYATGLVRSVAGILGMWLHVAAALALLPLVIWHVFARRPRPRRTDLSRRTLLRAGLFTAAAGVVYLVENLAGLPGSRRRFTGSYDAGSFNPAAMPSYTWLDDTTPALDPAAWRLSVPGRSFTLAELSTFDTTTVRATLDCTSGWYAEQDWTGVPVRLLLPPLGNARSLLVHSTTGYSVRFPLSDADTLLLATHVSGRPLHPGHGAPLRLVAPNRRGFWWVKWVDRIDLTPTPSWWQSPFPLT